MADFLAIFLLAQCVKDAILIYIQENLGSIISYFLFLFSASWQTDLSPRIVLNLLESRGYLVIGTTGIGQTYVATLHKKED